jgi:predicted alpha/beta hydrolase family esterase
MTISPEPIVLTVPGLDNSGPDHWQTLWEQERADCIRVELGMWDRPHRNTWVNKLNHAIRDADRPVVLAAHSLGCHAVAWWAALEQPKSDSPVIGALMVAPPDVDWFPLDPRISGFAPTPRTPLPFPSILVASRSDPYIGPRAARDLAARWGSAFADVGDAGHINASSRLGSWRFGQFLLERLLRGRENTAGGSALTALAEAPPSQLPA